MELKTKKQYSYFIYPFIVDEKKYDKYLLKLLKNKNCELKLWEKGSYLNLYTYFSENIKDYMFWPFSFSDDKKEKLKQLEDELESKILSQNGCTMFEYMIEKSSQGKIGETSDLFFNMEKIQIICFKTGVCFIVLKTTLGEESNILDVLDFNYKMRNVKTLFSATQENEDIKIQANTLKDINELSVVIKDIIGTNKDIKEENISTERVLTYSYEGIDEIDWNEEKRKDNLEECFYKLCNVVSSNSKLDSNKENNIYEISKFAKIGMTKQGSILINSNEDMENYEGLSSTYEQEYLYTYLLILYKKICLNKINNEFKKTKNFEKTKAKLLELTNEIWIQRITNNKEGYKLQKKWEEVLELDNTYEQLKTNMSLYLK